MGKKTVLDSLHAALAAIDKKLTQAEVIEAKARAAWTKLHHRFLDAAKELAHLKHHGTKKEAHLGAVIDEFDVKSPDLTRQRNEARVRMEELRREKEQANLELARVMAEEQARTRATDEVVAQVFALNTAVVQASIAREGYVTAHVFPLLIDPKTGSLRSQVTFTSADGLRRVMARVNTITIVNHDLAIRALELIDAFKARVRPDPDITDATTNMLFDLTDQLLVQRTNFKVGPDLYRFLRLDLDRKLFPELVEAQDLLKQSIRSEKTESYIRLTERASISSPWKQVRQG